MVFTSHSFVYYFLPLVLLGYYLLPGGRNLFLLAASYVFYGWWNPWFVGLMLIATAINHACGLVIAREPVASPRRRRALIASVVASLGLLGFFKYFMFAQGNFNALLSATGADPLPVLQITLPVGISFYIFQSLSYTIDVYRGDSPPVRSFTDFACFVALFPQLIAGPIVRYNTIAGQLIHREHTLDRFASGSALFMLGFAKKILLANPMGSMADAVFAAEAPGTAHAWLGVTAYAFQIYFDFSAYSDMAIGLGRLFGFVFPRNFNAPYRSESITEFWRRWHISLSTFLRDYLYIPLGGNRRGERRTYINLAIVMLLGGLWHGASWNFVLWGAFHGGLLALERCIGGGLFQWAPRPVRIAGTFVLVLFSWVLFRAVTLPEAGAFLSAMLFPRAPGGGAVLLDAVLYTRENVLILALCAVLALQGRQAHDWVEGLTLPRALVVLGLFAFALATMHVQAFNPFLYFQF
ncbi:MAG: MBOAT family protein [Candidatus Hydrogenedentes bacterium]|nr:MBOAT family protein [Candidatus Hydrogenedentota bacterium]